MHNRETLSALSKDQLIELIEIYSKNWLAMDGVWFQSVERKCGMDEAMYHDEEAWKRFTVTEARRIKKFLGLEEYAGFAKTIDPRISCECLSCYPEITDSTCCCKWKFTIPE
ncbi:hypothetical protein J6A32_07545 [Methanocorpusculum sp.]|nr:hypothetical protein [Methanocorpusculum sp.]